MKKWIALLLSAVIMLSLAAAKELNKHKVRQMAMFRPLTPKRLR